MCKGCQTASASEVLAEHASCSSSSYTDTHHSEPCTRALPLLWRSIPVDLVDAGSDAQAHTHDRAALYMLTVRCTSQTRQQCAGMLAVRVYSRWPLKSGYPAQPNSNSTLTPGLAECKALLLWGTGHSMCIPQHMPSQGTPQEDVCKSESFQYAHKAWYFPQGLSSPPQPAGW